MSVTAKVVVTLEVPVKSTWGEDCSMKQIYKQAKDDAEGMIRKSIIQHKGNDAERGPLYGSIILNMKVTAVLASEE